MQENPILHHSLRCGICVVQSVTCLHAFVRTWMESEVKIVDKPHGEVMFWLHLCTEMMNQGIVKHPAPPEQEIGRVHQTAF